LSSALAICHGAFGRATLYRLDRAMLTHAHREGHLVFFLEGEPATLLVDGRPQPTGRDVAVAIDPWAPHAHRPAAPGAAGLFLVLYVRPDWFAATSGLGAGTLRFGSPRIELSGSLEGRIRRVVALLAEPRGDGRLEDALLELTAACWERSWQGAAPPPARYGPLDFRVRRAMRLIGERLGEDLPFDRIAREAGLSRPHFYAMFKRELGITPNVYLNLLRVEEAIERLVATDRPVTEIAYELGFPCQSSFTRFFTTHVGPTPSEYRRRARLLAERDFQTRRHGPGGFALA
jgi:AraC-like DNA-binding protein